MTVPVLELVGEQKGYLSKRAAIALFREAEFGCFGYSFSLLQGYARENSLVQFIQRRLNTTGLTWDIGTHDHDAAKIFGALMQWRRQRSDLQFGAPIRSLAALWFCNLTEQQTVLLTRRAKTYAHMQEVYGFGSAQNLANEITVRISDFIEETFIYDWMEREDLALVGVYLVQVLSRETIAFTTLPRIASVCRKMASTLQSTGHWGELLALLEGKDLSLRDKWLLLEDWLLASTQYQIDKDALSLGVVFFFTPESVWLETTVHQHVKIDNLKGCHEEISKGEIVLDCSRLLG